MSAKNPTEKHQCSKRVYRGGYMGSTPCTRYGVVERNGKWYCRQHDPVAVAEHNAERQAKWDHEYKISTLRSKIRTTKIAIADAALDGDYGHTCEVLVLECKALIAELETLRDES
jgi:uncharacterized Zn finger protein (UPF0148 family)